jgi:NAD(P)-dependent dehydrogenase (short-subunit alcohol dehydrogenase family)
MCLGGNAKMDDRNKNEQGPRRKVVVVTGASAGVGRAIAIEFGRHGAAVGLLARGLDGLEGARKDVERVGGTACKVQADVADPDQVERAAAQIETDLGPIDIWINNAMVSVLSPVKDMTTDEFKRVTDVTYLGYVYGTLAALRRMLPRDRGVIIQIGSALAYRAIPLQSAYCAAKHAIQGFTESLRSELIHDGSHIHVATIHLPAVNTPQFSWIKSRMPRHPQPVPPIYQPEVIARAVYAVAQRPRREFWVGLPTVKAIIGDKLIPGLLDHYLAWMGYESQQTRELIREDRPNNLYESLPGDYGAHGRFDRDAQDSSLHVWANLNRTWLTCIGTGLLAACVWRARLRTSRAARRHRSIASARTTAGYS